MTAYDSTPDTLAHIGRVKQLAKQAVQIFQNQVDNHDKSKLSDVEKPLFDTYTPKLKDCVYGSDEYKQFLVELKPALDHHYANNRHHPEHHQNGIDDMDIFDLLEMLVDWKASSERNKDGDIFKSLKLNKERFGISDQLVSILENTAKRMFESPMIVKIDDESVIKYVGKGCVAYSIDNIWINDTGYIKSIVAVSHYPNGLAFEVYGSNGKMNMVSAIKVTK